MRVRTSSIPALGTIIKTIGYSVRFFSDLVAEGLIDFKSKVAQAVKAVGFAFDELDHGSMGQNLNPGVILLRKRKRT